MVVEKVLPHKSDACFPRLVAQWARLHIGEVVLMGDAVGGHIYNGALFLHFNSPLVAEKIPQFMVPCGLLNPRWILIRAKVAIVIAQRSTILEKGKGLVGRWS